MKEIDKIPIRSTNNDCVVPAGDQSRTFVPLALSTIADRATQAVDEKDSKPEERRGDLMANTTSVQFITYILR